MKWAIWLTNHRKSILFLFSTLALAGLSVAFYLPVTLFPQINFPRLMVSLTSGDRPTEQMLQQVTLPVEEVIRHVPGIQDMRSSTGRGTTDISITFDWGLDMPSILLQVNSAISNILTQLPQNTAVNSRLMDPSVFPILAYSMTSAHRDLVALRQLALYELRPLLSSIPGISQVAVVGGQQPEYEVVINPEKLLTYGLTTTDISQALANTNLLAVSGRLEEQYKLFLVESNAQLNGLSDLKNVIVKSTPTQVVRLCDVANITLGTMIERSRVSANGVPAVLFQIYQQPNGNSVQIVQRVAEKLKIFSAKLPADIHITPWYNQSTLVLDSAHSVRNAILLGVFLAAAVIFIFLRDIKITLIAALTVPASLACSTLLLQVFHLSFNIMTLGGMAAAVGLVIDDSIVLIEQIMHRLKSGGHYKDQIFQAASDFLKPLLGSSLATIVIFIPLAFLTGVTGAFFKALSFTMASALIFSFFMSWLVIPLLAEKWLTPEDAAREFESQWQLRLVSWYEKTLKNCLETPKTLGVLLLILIGSGFVAYHFVGSDFMPPMDEGGFVVDYKAKSGTSLTETARLTDQVSQVLKKIPEIDTFSLRTGASFGGADGFVEANEGDFLIHLKGFPRRPVEEIMDDVRQQIELYVPGLTIDIAQLMEDIIGDLTAVPQPIEIKIYSDDAKTLMNSALKIADEISKLSDVVDVNPGIYATGDAIILSIDPIKAAFQGTTPSAIETQLATYLAGDTPTFIQSAIQQTGVRVTLPMQLKDTSTALMRVMLSAPDGHLFALNQVAKRSEIAGQPQVTRENLQRMMAVTARISGSDMGSVIKRIQHLLNQHPEYLPRQGYYELGGLYQEQQTAFHDLLLVFLAAFVLVLLLQLFMYENIRLVLSIMVLPLLSLSAVFIGLCVTTTTLNIASMMGMTMIIGIITEVAIFYFSEYVKCSHTLSLEEALIQAGKHRIRPITMTTLAAILALLPLALGVGQGATMEQPLAIAIISGLVIQWPLVLLFMPVLFYRLHRIRPLH